MSLTFISSVCIGGHDTTDINMSVAEETKTILSHDIFIFADSLNQNSLILALCDTEFCSFSTFKFHQMSLEKQS